MNEDRFGVFFIIGRRLNLVRSSNANDHQVCRLQNTLNDRPRENESKKPVILCPRPELFQERLTTEDGDGAAQAPQGHDSSRSSLTVKTGLLR